MDNKSKNNFIESLFFGLFVQQLFIYEPDKQERFIIDGYTGSKQLTCSLMMNFHLKGYLNLTGNITEKSLVG